jgi:hypothetical protein
MINYFLCILCKTQCSCTHYTRYTKFEVFGFRDVTPCGLVRVYQYFLGKIMASLFCPHKMTIKYKCRASDVMNRLIVRGAVEVQGKVVLV